MRSWIVPRRVNQVVVVQIVVMVIGTLVAFILLALYTSNLPSH